MEFFYFDGITDLEVKTDNDSLSSWMLSLVFEIFFARHEILLEQDEVGL